MKKIALWAVVGLAILAAVAVGRQDAPEAEKPVVEQPVEEEVELAIVPAEIQQGEPARFVVRNAELGEVESLTFNGEELPLFEYESEPTALVGIDLRENPGTYPLLLALADGTTLSRSLVVDERARIEAPLGIPPQLGGNTPEAERELIQNLARENALLENVDTADEALWQSEFKLPLTGEVVVTDDYGYTRLTGSSEIAHKGTDFRAAVGTPVRAMNDGVVRLAREFIVYGQTVVIDHGLGVQTLYMHLSGLDVEEGESVRRGDVVGKSGKTGYAEFPHLHVSVKIGGISIDPMKFLELF